MIYLHVNVSNGTYSLGRGGAFEEKEETWWICSTIYSDATQREKKL